jgi:hypothetical protein
MSQQQQALPASQLEALCRAGRIERTMYLLFVLNHWAKARDRLFFADRQGLYRVKAALLRQAYIQGALSTWCYVDGSAAFGEELAFDMAADIAAEGLLWRLGNLSASSPDEQEDHYDQIAHRLYTRITGRETIVASEVEALATERVRDYILARLHDLEREARAGRRPIPHASLSELCIAPSDLLLIHDRRYYELSSWDSWDQLDESDLRMLDPEGLSLIAFQYLSPDARYLFHLPLRLAEAFVPAWIIDQLKLVPWTCRERGEYYGRAVTPAESLQLPAAQILQELGVDIATICPHRLSEKREDALDQSIRFHAYREEENCDEDAEEIDECDWQEGGKPSRKEGKLSPGGRCSPDACPLCHVQIDAIPARARLNHWQAEHSDQDLTFCQASWVLNGIQTPGQITGKKEFCQHYPPDYRALHEEGGTRYWRVETLRGWLENKGGEEGKR